jgi:hypothetical protein
MGCPAIAGRRPLNAIPVVNRGSLIFPADFNQATPLVRKRPTVFPTKDILIKGIP